MSKIKEFDPAIEKWPRFVKRLQNYFIAERIANDDVNKPIRKAKLLQLMGIELLNKYYDSVGENVDQTFDEIVEQINKMVNPQPLEIAERFRFLNRRQQSGETAAQYMAELRKSALNCNFEKDAIEPLNARLRDQFVCGLAKMEMKQYLLQQEKLTVENVVNLATSFEAAENTTELLSQSSTTKFEVNSVTKNKYSTNKKPWDKQLLERKTYPECKHCGKTNHVEERCFKVRKCHKCGKTGHMVKFCPKWKQNNKPKAKTTNAIEDHESESGDDKAEYSNYISEINNVNEAGKFLVDLQINGYKTVLEYDTGSGETILSENCWKKIGSPRLRATDRVFSSYSGHKLQTLGTAKVEVQIAKKKFVKMPVYVVQGTKMSLFGRKWIKTTKLETKHCRIQSSPEEEIAKLAALERSKHNEQVKPLLEEYSELFDGKLGCIKGVKVGLTIKPNVKVRKFWQARSVPFALEGKVETALDRLEKRQIIERISNDISEYASPIVVVAKKDTDAVRICGDFKVSINQMIEPEQYPLPTAEEMFAKIGDCVKFAKVDMEEAYHQLELDEEAQKYLVINTKKGLYKYKRLPFGIAPACSIFQRVMHQILQGLPGVNSFFDDILVGGRTDEELYHRLKALFQRLKEKGAKLGLNKCTFFKKVS